ncbi:MAG: GTP cyclohydrolase I, partial [Actinomycetota bacterium]
MEQPNRTGVADAIARLLSALGEDAARAGLRDTPARVADAYAELLSGRDVDPASVLDALPGERGEGLILVKDIRLLG